MYELSVALKYLIPRRRQLSVSIIALLSVLVISLVVWLVVVFLSVTRGIERRWIETLVSLNAPVRLTPTEAYYNSYYYRIDQFSGASDYSPKTIGEKRLASGDPYNPDVDGALPMGFPPNDGHDPVAGAFSIIENIEGAQAHDFELGIANLQLKLVREESSGPFDPIRASQTQLNQVSYLASYTPDNRFVAKTLCEPTSEDLTHYVRMLSRIGAVDAIEEFLSAVKISGLQVVDGWALPPHFYPKEGVVLGKPVMQGDLVDHVILGQGDAEVEFCEGGFCVRQDGEELALSRLAGLLVPDGTAMEASIAEASDLSFNVAFDIGSSHFEGATDLSRLALHQAQGAIDPIDDAYGVILAKSYQKHDVQVGDRGFLSYYDSTPSGAKEQRIPIFVKGFYDPGMMPAGHKMILVDPEVTSDVRTSLNAVKEGNGIQVFFDDVYRAPEVKEQIMAGLAAQGIDHYWKVESYQDYDFAQPLLQQFHSDRVLFTLLAVIIIAVACSNIISMLILLVNDKRREIGILRAMGATGRSVLAIFAICGTVMGLLGSTLGILAAWFTLRNIQGIVGFLSAIQGHEAFQTAFFGDKLPSELSGSVLTLVIGSTIVVSIIAGAIPAIKAAMVKPANVLRSG